MFVDRCDSSRDYEIYYAISDKPFQFASPIYSYIAWICLIQYLTLKIEKKIRVNYFVEKNKNSNEKNYEIGIFAAFHATELSSNFHRERTTKKNL